MQVNAKTFPLKSGSCHIYPDSIQIRGKGLTHFLSNLFSKWGFERTVVFYGLLALGFIASSALSIGIQNYFLAVFFGIAALFSLRLAWINRKVSFAPTIPKKQIEYIEYLPAIPGERRNSFLIVYKSGERLLHRNLVLPTRKGDMIAQSAYYMVKDTGLLKEERPRS
ncbi:MAG: hypothetical protein AAF694_18125 [Bacteroidota bacterium]